MVEFIFILIRAMLEIWIVVLFVEIEFETTLRIVSERKEGGERLTKQ
jgi:hypothetical protein